MKIGCIAWGSLLWKPGRVPLRSGWHAGGPALPLEFARVGPDGELAVVLCPGAPKMPTRWAWLDLEDLVTARERLREREQVPREHPEWIASAVAGETNAGDASQVDIDMWLATAGLDACVWTATPACWNDREGHAPTAEDAVAYLDGLTGATRAHADDYVRRVPVDIRTGHREAIERRLGWTPRG